MFTKIFYALMLILLPLSGATSYAQEIAPEKRDLLKELLVVTDAKKNPAFILDAMTEQLQKQPPKKDSRGIVKRSSPATGCPPRRRGVETFPPCRA